MSTSVQITNYFSLGERSTAADITIGHADKVSKFYTSSVKNQLKSDKCDDQVCAHRKRELLQQLAQSEEKLAQTKGAINTCKRIIEQKTCKLNLLRGQMNEQIQTVNRKEPGELFNKYKTDFTNAGLSELRSIGGKKRDDSNFILTGMRFLYHNHLHRLNNISVTGGGKQNSKNNAGANIERKEKMTPKKLEAIKGAFIERLNFLQLDGKEHKQRTARINILVNNAIQNLNSKKSLKQCLDTLNKQINSAGNLLS